MPTISLLLNLAVLLPVCAGLIGNASWTIDAYGAASPARGILLSVYLAIAVLSAFLLWVGDPKLIAALLMAQVIYKVTTPLTVGTIHQPVVTANLMIAAFHAVTMIALWRDLDQA